LWSSLEESALKKRYVVRLSRVEREQLEGLVKQGREAAYRCHHAQVLLLADEGERGSGANSPEEHREAREHKCRAECAPGRTRAAEGNDRRPIVCTRNRTAPISGFAKNGDAPERCAREGFPAALERHQRSRVGW